MSPCRQGVVWLGFPLLGAPDTGRTWGCDLAPGPRLTAPPLASPAQHQNMTQTFSSKCATVKADTPSSPSRAPVCSCPCSAHRSIWHVVGMRSGITECQCRQERTRTAYAGGKGHAQPWE